MLRLLPKARELPTWAQTLEALGNPSPSRLAPLLDVSERTLARWSASGNAPRAALLALWPLTPWGMERANLQLLRERNDCEALAESLQRERRGLLALVEELQAQAYSGAANGPLFDVLQAAEVRAWGRRPTAASSSPAAPAAGRRLRRQ